MLRRWLRKSATAMKDWLIDDPNVRPKDHPNCQRYAYPWLNHLLCQMMRQGQGVLRPNYTLGMLYGACVARHIGVERISVIEFGVAGGNGLLAMDRAAEMIEKELNVGIDVYGFDTGQGLPRPSDYRDLPNLYVEGTFTMNRPSLEATLHRAKLIIGDVSDTVPQFVRSGPAPVAYISNDLDYYSSTAASFKLLEADAELLMPRIYSHFDDVLGLTFADHNGERLAIAEFNEAHPKRQISPIYGFRHYVPRKYRNADWIEEAYIVHVMDHARYNEHDGLVKPHHLVLQANA